MDTLKKKRISYDCAFKLKVITFAEEHGNRAAERNFGISESNVRLWRKKKYELEKMPKDKRANRHGDTPFKLLESDLCAWISEIRSRGLTVSRMSIRAKALLMSQDKKYEIDQNFKASAGWCTRFMNRNGLTIRRRTHIAQKLPNDVNDKVAGFHKFVIDMRKKQQYDLAQIGNMDETPMYFDMASNSTVEQKGAPTVSVRTTGHEKSHFTVVLACMADGTKLTPMIIFKRKTMPKITFPPGVIVRVHEKGWMDEELTKEWLKVVWGNRPGGLRTKASLLVWDQFRAHLCDSVKTELKELNTSQAVIPGGCTSLLQPLDVCINKPFKDHLRTYWNQWMMEGDHEYTKGGAQKKADLISTVKWVINAWSAISPEIIIKSFKKTGISNEMNGEEDDMLYDDILVEGDAKEDDSTGNEEMNELDDFYDDDGNGLVNEDVIRRIFESDSEEEEFRGFNL